MIRPTHQPGPAVAPPSQEMLRVAAATRAHADRLNTAAVIADGDGDRADAAALRAEATEAQRKARRFEAGIGGLTFQGRAL